MTRTDWTREEIAALFDLPFTELMFRAAETHRANHAAGEVQLCTLLSIKTGGCPEDCGYCSQSVNAKSGLKAEKLMDVDAVLAAAAEAKAHGSQRFCMGAAWREPKDRDMAAVCEMVAGVKAMGLETCMTLGMLTGDQARAAQGGGPRLLQSQHRHLARTLWRHHHDANVPGAARYARGSAQRGDGGVLRRDRRDGRDPRATASASSTRWRRCRAIPKACRSTRWCRSRGRCWATCSPDAAGADRRHRVRAHGRGGADHDAAQHGAAVGRAREHERGDAGLVLPRGGQFDLHRRQVADHRQCRGQRRRGAAGQARHEADAGRGADAGDWRRPHDRVAAHRQSRRNRLPDHPHRARRWGFARSRSIRMPTPRRCTCGMADEAVHIGPSPARESYLVGDKIIAAAKATGAEAIHPGYGFLSENADFAQAVIDAGLVWVGPEAGQHPRDGAEGCGQDADGRGRRAGDAGLYGRRPGPGVPRRAGRRRSAIRC